MSYLDVLDRVTLFRSLHAIDVELAAKVRAGGCVKCGGPLHMAKYERQPRGESIEVPAEYRYRLGLCCGWCRRRTLPPSSLFFGRKVFWGCVVMLVTAAAEGLERRTIAELCRRFRVSRRTIKRWISFFVVLFPLSPTWVGLRGRIGHEVRDDDLPRGLLSWFIVNACGAEQGLVGCLKAISGSELVTKNEGPK